MELVNVDTKQAIKLYTPMLYLNGFPKSGLHLCTRFVEGMGLQRNNPVKNWLGTNPWTVIRYHLDTWITNIVKLQPGQFIKGHTGWMPHIEFSLIERGIGCIFIYRDLRDVVVSQMYHVLSDDDEQFKHQDKEIYKAMGSKEEVMLAIIEGVDIYDGIIPRFETYAPWLDSTWTLSLRFEEMINNYYRTANKIYDYVIDVMRVVNDEEFYPPHEYRHEAVKLMIDNAQNKEDSVTFRKGKSGGWRKEFTPEVVDCYKEHDNGWLVKLGYEQDEDWSL